MNRLLLILMMVLALLAGCVESQQHPITVAQMKKVSDWANVISKEMQILRSNQLYLKRNMFDPNEIVLLKELVE